MLRPPSSSCTTSSRTVELSFFFLFFFFTFIFFLLLIRVIYILCAWTCKRYNVLSGGMISPPSRFSVRMIDEHLWYSVFWGGMNDDLSLPTYRFSVRLSRYGFSDGICCSLSTIVFLSRFVVIAIWVFSYRDQISQDINNLLLGLVFSSYDNSRYWFM